MTRPLKVGKMIQENVCKVTEAQLGLHHGGRGGRGTFGGLKGSRGTSGGSPLKLGQNPGEEEDVKGQELDKQDPLYLDKGCEEKFQRY